MTAHPPKPRHRAARSIFAACALLLSSAFFLGCNAFSGGDGCCGGAGGEGCCGICDSLANPRTSADIDWGPLNAARGDQSPQAGDLWGDRTGDGATGFLVQFKDGFSSPPHIHNITYRGIVIQGNVHNDHPDADVAWMPPGSAWVQPAGGVHITAAQGDRNMAYIEIASGPYLVQPPADAFDSDDQPRNIHADDMPWADAGHGVQTARLWGGTDQHQPTGTLVKLPANFRGSIHSPGGTLHAVIIAGDLLLHTADPTDTTRLEPGNYFGSTGQAAHRLANASNAPTLVYLRTDQSFDVTLGEAGD